MQRRFILYYQSNISKMTNENRVLLYRHKSMTFKVVEYEYNLTVRAYYLILLIVSLGFFII